MTGSLEIPRIASGQTQVPASLCDAVRSAADDAPTSRDLALLAAALAPVFAAPPSLPVPPPNGLTQSASLGARVLGTGAGKATTIGLAALVAAAGAYGVHRWTGSSVPRADDIAPAAQVETAAEAPAPNAVPAEPRPAEPGPAGGAVAAPQARSRESTRPRAVETSANPAEAPKQQLSEWALVEQARRALASDPKKALALVEEHHQKFAGGRSSEEADFIEIEAQKRLGHVDEARAFADRFKKRYPSSIHGQSVTVPPAPKP